MKHSTNEAQAHAVLQYYSQNDCLGLAADTVSSFWVYLQQKTHQNLSKIT